MYMILSVCLATFANPIVILSNINIELALVLSRQYLFTSSNRIVVYRLAKITVGHMPRCYYQYLSSRTIVSLLPV